MEEKRNEKEPLPVLESMRKILNRWDEYTTQYQATLAAHFPTSADIPVQQPRTTNEDRHSETITSTREFPTLVYPNSSNDPLESEPMDPIPLSSRNIGLEGLLRSFYETNLEESGAMKKSSSGTSSSAASQRNLYEQEKWNKEAERLRVAYREKESRCSKLSIQAANLGDSLDQMKLEVKTLTSRLEEIEEEIGKREKSILSANRIRKKILLGTENRLKKESSKKSVPSSYIDALRRENEQLHGAENDLLEALQELTAQNSDLIEKLRESRERELDLSSRRATLVAQQAIYDKSPPISGRRSQPNLETIKNHRGKVPIHCNSR